MLYVLVKNNSIHLSIIPNNLLQVTHHSLYICAVTFQLISCDKYVF